MEIIRNFKDISKEDVGLAGGKGASLGEMTRAGIPVPEGFVILSNVFEDFIEKTELNVEIDSILDTVKHEEVHTVENASEKIQALIISKKMPKDIGKSIIKEFSKLKSKYVAVRSSATSEDSAEAAWAGQLDTFLNTTKDNLLENVKKCWASLFTPRAIFYRFEKDLQKEKVSVAVVIQKMIQSEESGIAFSVHPVTQNRNQLIIEAGFGLGEAIVSGQITPDSYVVDKQDLHMIDKNVNEQAKGIFGSSKGGSKWKDLGNKGKEQVLTNDEIIELSKLIVHIENHYGFPVDVEWAKEKGKFYITQSRPITTLTDLEFVEDNILKDIETHTFERYERAPIQPLISYEYAFRSYIDNPYFKKINSGKTPNLVVLQTDNYGAWEEKSTRVKLNDKRLIKKVINNGLKRIKKYKKQVNNFLKISKLDSKKCIEGLKDLNDLCIDIYHSYIFFTVEYFNTSDKELLKILPEVRMKLSNFIETVWASYDKILYFIEKNYDLSKKELDMCTSEEILGLLEGDKTLLGIKNLERRPIAFTIIDNKFKFFFNKDALTIKKHLDSQGTIERDIETAKTNKSIFGNSANKGVAKGSVLRITEKDYKNYEKVFKDRKDYVLVAPMTRPEVVPFLKDAKAIITDEGGITCHAAIVSRELDIPCVIGTKIATQVLKNGMEVEVDANEGIVRILEKENKIFELEFTREAPIDLFYVWLEGYLESCRILGMDLNLPNKTFVIYESGVMKGYTQKDNIELQKQAINKLDKNNLKKIIKVYLDHYKKFEKNINLVKDKQFLRELMSGFVITFILGDIEKHSLQKEALNARIKTENLFTLILKNLKEKKYSKEEKRLSILDRGGVHVIKDKDDISKYLEKNNLTLDSNKKTLTSIFSREKSLIYFCVWDDSDRKGIEFTGEKVKNSFFRVPKKGEKGSVWYEKNELEYLKNKTSDMLRVEKNNKSWKEIKKLSVSSWKFLEPYAKGKKVIKTPKEFEKYYSNLVDFWVCLNSFLYEILDDKTVDKNIRKYLDEFRDKTEEYTEKMSSNLDEYIETHIKKNKEIIPFINKDEVMKIINRKVSNKEILEFKKRTKGCFMLNQKVYTLSELDKVLGKNELGLEKITEDVDEFFGDSAYKGIVEGTVKVIKGFNDLDKISKGDILVTEMTNPKYLPAIKKASAVVTNEGGTLCHAAIVAREMKKPCIIGTKVATKVLSDGTKIMVDANNGIVKILEKTERPEFPPVNWHPISKRGRNHPIFIIDTMVNALSKRYDKTIYGVDLTIHEYRQIDKKREISEKDYQSIIKSLLDWAENNPSVIEKIATTSLEYVDELNDKINEWETNKIWKKEEKWEQVIDEFFTLTSKIWAGAIGYSYIFLGELVAPKFVKEVLEINNKFTEEEVLYLLQPEETTEMTLLTKELEKLASKLKTKEISLSKVDVALTSLKEKYGHLGRYYFWGKSYDKEDLLKWVKKLAKEKSKNNKSTIDSKKIKKIRLSPELSILRRGLQKYSLMANKADELVNETIELFSPIWYGIAKKFDIKYEHVASMRKDEIIVSLNKNKLVVNKAELTRRIRDHIFWFHNGEIILDTQNIYKGELKLQKEDVSESTSILKGQNASVNVNINGIVKILHTPKEMSKLKEGEILVTSMTNPEFLPAMQRAAGFITEDGGLLSHAAIVARELKIPCIIGTKYATQVLKDGMEVEVDADKGVVKILK